MLSYTELKKGKVVLIGGQPYEILAADFLRMQQRKGVVQAKFKNLITGKVASRSIHQNEQFKEVGIEKRAACFLYSHRGESWFCALDNHRKRFPLRKEMLGGAAKFLKPNSEVTMWRINNQIIAVKPPIKVDLKVKEAPPGDRGDTAGGGRKAVVLETGAVIQTPLFIKTGDIVRVNTETGEYTERVETAKD